ncbi:MAG TPA: hypothetical protein DCE43_02650, partial [Planctomycetaceae bacterium]|nr:hypothetical protein [Planctomycetaceae bacterium]
TARSADRREVTTVAPQALELFNGEFVNRQSRHFADRIIAEAGPSAGAQLDHGFRLALGRLPTPGERASLAKFLSNETSELLAEDRRRRGVRARTAAGEIVQSGLTLWLDAAHGVTLNDQKHVSRWASRVGSLVATAHGDPRQVGQALGKHSAIDFQGKDWFGLNAPPVTGQQFTAVA